MENVRKDRTQYRAKHIPVVELYTQEELQELINEFDAAKNEKQFISEVNLQAILLNMNIEL